MSDSSPVSMHEVLTCGDCLISVCPIAHDFTKAIRAGPTLNVISRLFNNIQFSGSIVGKQFSSLNSMYLSLNSHGTSQYQELYKWNVQIFISKSVIQRGYLSKCSLIQILRTRRMFLVHSGFRAQLWLELQLVSVVASYHLTLQISNLQISISSKSTTN